MPHSGQIKKCRKWVHASIIEHAWSKIHYGVCVFFYLKTICHKWSVMITIAIKLYSLIYLSLNNILLMTLCPKFMTFKISWLLFTTHYICPYLKKTISKLSVNPRMAWSLLTTNCDILSPLKPIFLWNGHWLICGVAFVLMYVFFLYQQLNTNTCWIPPWSKCMTGLINPQCKILTF